MLFNSYQFLVFFCFAYPLYLLCSKSLRLQNWALLGLSLYFYACWDERFLVLLLVSAGIDYWAGLRIYESEDLAKKKRILWLSVFCNLGILGFFKYYGFFADNLKLLFSQLGWKIDVVTFQILLPVGISFYTFQSMSYGIDVYRGRLKPTKNLLAYFLMVSFFPHLVAGPIVRASRLLPQMLRPRVTSWAQINAGLWLILWGYWKKVVMADNLADLANPVFNDWTKYNGFDVSLGVLAFTFQIYGDFSGYTDIARGISKLMGFELDLNFDIPYIALSPSDFWQRWHISLSSWLRDYLYISLGGNRYGEARTLRNLMATMVLGGLWHGAAWNFIIWGFYHGSLLCVYRKLEATALWKTVEKSPSKSLCLSRWALMFAFTCFGWILFRATSLESIAYIITHIGIGNRSWHSQLGLYQLILFVSPLILIEFGQVASGDRLVLSKAPLALRVAVYTVLLFSILVFCKSSAQDFLYFQF